MKVAVHEVDFFYCPTCRAFPYEPCVGVEGFHASRLLRAGVEGPPLAKQGKWARVAGELRSSAGDWRRVMERAPVESGWYAARRLRTLGCEARTRAVDGRADVWARWPACG